MVERVLYDLAGQDDAVLFSPHGWRVRMALAHKNLDFRTEAWRFTEKDAISFSGQGTIPVLVDGDRVVVDSWKIAVYLDEAYPDAPALLGGPQGRAHALFVKSWAESVLQPGIVRQILLDLFEILHEGDKAYFRETREQRFGCTLEAFGAEADANLPQFRKSLQPLRMTVSQQPYLGGEMPSFADYIVFGAFQWARVASSKALLEDDDPIVDWRGRMLGLFGGLAEATPARAAVA
jgi:glutathione S-transferase